MAYIKELDRQCSVMFCGKRAVVAIYNNRNACIGEYCRKCGKAALRTQQLREASA
jgi:hypothetical protein